MEFGLVLQCDPPARRLVELARRAEQAGFTHVWTFDSPVLWQEPFVIYSAILEATSNVIVGPMVTNPLTRDWTVTASLFATLNEMYGNRTICGIGRGDSAVRVPGGKPARLETLAESMRVIRGLARGETVLLNGNEIRMPWVTDGALEIWMAAYGPKALDLAGREADGLILQLADPYLVEWSARIAREAHGASERAEEGYTVLAAAPAYVGSDLVHQRDQVRWFGGMVGNHVADLVARYGERSGEVPDALTEYIEARPTYDYSHHGRAGNPSADFVPDDIVDRFCVLGDNDAHIAKIEELADLGVDQFAVYLMHDAQEATLDAYGSTVVPYFRDPARKAFRLIDHEVRVHRSAERLAREDELAWRLAELATDRVEVDADVAEMVENRVIDNTGVAAAALFRHPVVAARAQALSHPYAPGATVFGLAQSRRFSPEWAAWANGVAVRELDFHDTFLAAEYSHPGDNIPPLVAVAQHRGRSGAELVAAITTAYEVQVDLAKSISLHAHTIDHVAHLGPSVAAGLGTLLGLSTEVIYQAINQSLHVTTATRQLRKGEISSWKAFAPAFAGKMAIEAVDRAIRGEAGPAPIYEGEDGVIATLLDGPGAVYVVSLPAKGESKRAILDTYTKAHSAEYQAQALIDLAFRLRGRIGDLSKVASITIHTSHHTDKVIGTGANDPQKFDPDASRETLDHSSMYIVAVALEDGTWDHETSYTRERARRPETVALWQKIRTVEDPEWTARYHATDPAKKAFGGRIVVEMGDGALIKDELAVADAHPLGAHPYGRAEYVAKFRRLCEGVVAPAERDRFLSLVERLGAASAEELSGCTFVAERSVENDLPEGLF